MVRRGSYAKGVAKREEILDAALGVIAREGYRAASVREIADAVGLSQAGLLHYFDSKEHLFVEILRKRDERDVSALATTGVGDMSELYLHMVRASAEVPGLVHLFSRMAVEAADPEHPAHAYFVEHGEGFRATLRVAFEAARDAGRLAPGVTPDDAARLVQAAWDGAQLQWLVEPSTDMTAVVHAAFAALVPR